MKRFNKGFTLAEVLITLTIIGVVSAIVLPSVISNNQYKSIGVKLGKFLATVENSTIVYVANNTGFSSADTTSVQDFINEAFVFKSIEGNPEPTEYPLVATTKDDSEDNPVNTSDSPVAILKDGTGVRFLMDSTPYIKDNDNDNDKGSLMVKPEKFGSPVFKIEVYPNVHGLPSTVQKIYSFSVTELGHIFPYPTDKCTWDLYRDDFKTNIKKFAEDAACNTNAQNNAKEGEGGEGEQK